MHSRIPIPTTASATRMPTPRPAPRAALFGPEFDDDDGVGNPSGPTQRVEVAWTVTKLFSQLIIREREASVGGDWRTTERVRGQYQQEDPGHGRKQEQVLTLRLRRGGIGRARRRLRD